MAWTQHSHAESRQSKKGPKLDAKSSRWICDKEYSLAAIEQSYLFQRFASGRKTRLCEVVTGKRKMSLRLYPESHEFVYRVEVVETIVTNVLYIKRRKHQRYKCLSINGTVALQPAVERVCRLRNDFCFVRSVPQVKDALSLVYVRSVTIKTGQKVTIVNRKAAQAVETMLESDTVWSKNREVDLEMRNYFISSVSQHKWVLRPLIFPSVYRFSRRVY